MEAGDVRVAVGRQPNTDTLALENAGVETDDDYVETDEFLERLSTTSRTRSAFTRRSRRSSTRRSTSWPQFRT
ncbi:hypothetical protein [Natronococcus sp. A-GB7]|uniref:hypothetical protein n=1 Tax=Natronococcus sp. A-GB7 TaxID=3037649 RepID=UPI0024200042|nr:hypothetical protein [Natronococcus sp. A-GB7]MDG5819991.1 hypothetical protein [Natronococcus sp. A-GB7]